MKKKVNFNNHDDTQIKCDDHLPNGNNESRRSDQQLKAGLQ